MVVENTIADNPTLGVKGVSSIPNTYNVENILTHTPSIELSALNNMFRTDGQVGGLYRILTSPLRGSKFRIHRAHKRGNRERDFIEDVFRKSWRNGGMRLSLSQVMATILRMLIDGWSPHEIVWDIRDGFVRVDKIAHRPASTIGVKVNRSGDIVQYIQDPIADTYLVNNAPGNGGKITIPTDKVLHFVHGSEWNPIFGRSLFTQAYYHYQKKHKLYYIAHIAAQIRALKIRLVKAPSGIGKAQIDDFLKEVAKIGFNSTYHIPDGWEIEFPDVGGDTVDVIPLIQHHDSQMSKSVLAQVVDVGSEGRSGSFNLSDTHLDIFVSNLDLIAANIADVFNNVLIPNLINWNFGTDAYPKIEFMPFDRQEKKALTDLFIRIASAKTLNTTPDFLLEMEEMVAEKYGLDIEYTDDFKNDAIKFIKEKMINEMQQNTQPEVDDDDDPDGNA